MFTNLSSILSVVTVVLGLCLTVGGLFAMKQGYSKASGDAQDRVISALKTEVELLTSRIADLERRNTELQVRQDTIICALDKKKIKVTIDGDMVTLTDREGSSTLRNKTLPTAKPIPKMNA